MKRDSKVELFYLLIWQVLSELKTLSIITKKEEQRVLKSTNHCSLLKNAYERWIVKWQEAIFPLDRQN